MESEKKVFIEQTIAAFLGDKRHSHSARLAYWHQLKKLEPSQDCLSFVGTHLWLSSLLHAPHRNTLFIDPVLAERIVTRYREGLLELVGEPMPDLWDRDALWTKMLLMPRVLILARPEAITATGDSSWILVDVRMCQGVLAETEVLLPPSELMHLELCQEYVRTLIKAIRQFLPGRGFLSHSAKLEQKVTGLVLPQPHTDERIGLVMLAHLSSKLLFQEIGRIDVPGFHQSLCYFFDKALRPSQVNMSFPWPGLTNQQGMLCINEPGQDVARRRFAITDTQPGVLSNVFPRSMSYSAPLALPGPSTGFFAELTRRVSSHTEDMLIDTSGRSVDCFEKAVLLAPYPSWPSRLSDHKLQRLDALSLDEYAELIDGVGGPLSDGAQNLVLTGKHEGERITLDWLKDAHELEKEWLLASTDVDSLSLTTKEAPEFLEAGNYHPYPSRALSLTFKNDLSVCIDGRPAAMHQFPNICLMTLGANNQFRFLVFFPLRKSKVTERMYRNIPNDEELRTWYSVFLTALRMVVGMVSPEYCHVAIKTLEGLPMSYNVSANQSTKAGPRSFTGYRVEPGILNFTLMMMRRIIDREPQYATYRSYFFHLCGINLKLATQTIHGREDVNPLNFAFRANPFIDWYQQNPNNIAVDVGVAINLDPGAVPSELTRSTLLYRYAAIRQLLYLGWTTPQRDKYCHSFVVSGLRAHPTAEVKKGAGIMKIQAYHKDMLQTYRHRDKSIGANFTVDEALLLGKQKKFDEEMKAYREILEEPGSYGLRLEFRLGPWAANRLMSIDPREILDRLFDARAIVCHSSVTIAQHKLLLNRVWCAVIKKQQRLPKQLRQSPEVALLTCVLAYWLKGLVKRPDDMSSTVEMADLLYLVDNASSYGLPSLRSASLQATGDRMSYAVEADTFKILNHVNVIRPGGNRIKSSRLPKVIAPPDPLLSPPPTPARALLPPSGSTLWTERSQEFLNNLIDVWLPKELWRRFPGERLADTEESRRLRRAPLRISAWQKIVEPMNLCHEVKGKFPQTIDRLFPQNWEEGSKAAEMRAHDNAILLRVREHLDSQPQNQRAAYSDQLRRKIKAKMMAEWEYLPSVHAHKIWTFKSGRGGNRVYSLCRKA